MNDPYCHRDRRPLPSWPPMLQWRLQQERLSMQLERCMMVRQQFHLHLHQNRELSWILVRSARGCLLERLVDDYCCQSVVVIGEGGSMAGANGWTADDVRVFETAVDCGFGLWGAVRHSKSLTRNMAFTVSSSWCSDRTVICRLRGL